MNELSQWVGSLPLSVAMRPIVWLVPFLQALHILSIAMILSAVVMIDLRVWGISHMGTLSATSRRFLPWLWVAVAVSALTGIALMLGTPRSWRDSSFVAKLVLMAAAALATLALPVVLRWNGNDKEARFAAGFVGGLALLLWVSATFAGRGRWIAGMLGV
jgi:hypothetical protein